MSGPSALYVVLALLPQAQRLTHREYEDLLEKEKTEQEAHASRQPRAFVRLALGGGFLSGTHAGGTWDRQATSVVAPEVAGQLGWSATAGVYLTIEGRVSYLRENKFSGAREAREFSAGVDWYPFVPSGVHFSVISGYCELDRDAALVRGMTLATGAGVEFGKPGVVTFGPMARVAFLRMRSQSEYFTVIKAGLQLGATVPWR